MATGSGHDFYLEKWGKDSIFTTKLSSAKRYSPQSNSRQPVVAMTSRGSGVRTHIFTTELSSAER